VNKKVMGYFGGKNSHLDFILPHLCRAECFVDVFGGSGAVILNYHRSKKRVYNDIDKNVVNFFRQLREHPDELITLINLTLYSRQEYIDAYPEEGDSDLELARKYFVRIQQGILNIYKEDRLGGWSVHRDRGDGSRWKGLPENLWSIVGELKENTYENRSFELIIPQFDHPTTLFYIDPPYVWEGREKGAVGYVHEMDDKDHRLLGKLLNEAKGMVAISGYETDLYAELFQEPKWKKVYNKEMKIGSGAHTKQEVMWLNYNLE
jgi:DNA adenine methylase